MIYTIVIQITNEIPIVREHGSLSLSLSFAMDEIYTYHIKTSLLFQHASLHLLKIAQLIEPSRSDSALMRFKKHMPHTIKRGEN